MVAIANIANTKIINKMVNFDDILFEINDFGKYQKIRYLLICLAGMLPPIVTYLHSFTAAKPDYRCLNPYDDLDIFTNKTFESENLTLKACDIIQGNLSYKCDKWVFDKKYYQSTLTEEWSLICGEKKYWGGHLQTVYFSGYLVGSLGLGLLADTFGRRPIMLSSFILILIGGFGAAFGPQKSIGTLGSFIIYALCRFLIAVGTRGINVTGFVLGMEIVGKSKRTFAGIVFEYFFALGQLVLVLMAYLIRDWRTLAWVAILPTIPFLSYYFFIPESARWLVSKNRHDEAFEIIKKIAKSNNQKVNKESWDMFLESETKKAQSLQSTESLLSIFKSCTLATITLVLFLNWIINNFVFYGVGLRANDLGMNPYLTFAISALMELVAYIVTHFIVDKLGRKYPYFFFLLAAGISCVAITLFDNDNPKQQIYVVVMAMIGKFFASAAYATIYMYSSEMFPTSIRNSCMGACSMMARIGSMVAPQINNLSDTTWKSLPYLIFGISGIVGAFSSLVFSETLNRNMPQNIKEAEELSAIRCCKKNRDNKENIELQQ